MLKLHKLKDDRIRVGLISGSILVMIGCGQITTRYTPDGTASPPLEPAQITETKETPVPPTEGDATQMIPPLPTTANPSLQSLIEKAREHLAQQLSISITQISLVEVVDVEWSDSSLDCPQPGMEYLQVITPGYRIHLEFGGNLYEYHSNRDTYVIYCENRIPPIIPQP